MPKVYRTGGQHHRQRYQFQEETHAKYQIVVKDTGIGMSEEFLPQLFEPYARETRFTAQKITGTRPGHAIVKNLVTQMSGQIQVESHLGQGTTFTLVLPLEAVRSQEMEKTEDRETDQKSAQPAAVGPDRAAAYCWRRTTR